MAVVDAWAWWSKEIGSDRDYSVIDSGSFGEELSGIDDEIRALSLGNPPSAGHEGGLPWVSFASTAEPHPRTRVCWWDWTEGRDVGGRPILAVLYLRLDLPGPPGMEALAGYARTLWQQHRRDRAALSTDPPPIVGADLGDLTVDPDLRRWAAAVAALALCTRVRVITRDGDTPEQAARLLDGIVALLPAPVRNTLVVTTGINRDTNGPYIIAVGRAAERDAELVHPDTMPDLRAFPEAEAYRLMLERLFAIYPVEKVVAYLTAAPSLSHKLGKAAAQAGTAYLARMDRLTEVGDALLRREPVELDEVRLLVDTNTLTDRLPKPAHGAFLRHLLQHGDAEDLNRVAGQWLPGTETLLIDAVGDRERRQTLSAEWIEAAIVPVEVADADRVLLPLLDRYGATAPVAALLAAVVPVLAADATRARLLQTARQDQCAELVRLTGTEVPRWLAGADHAPDWTKLLVDAVMGNRGSRPDVTDPHWLAVAADLAGKRHPALRALETLLSDLVAAATHTPKRNPCGLWLETLPVADSASRASADFVLLISGQTLPPGLRSGSPFARTEVYARYLADQVTRFPESAERVRLNLVRWLAHPDATEDAVILLDLLLRSGRFEHDEVLDAVAQVVEDRPDLLDRHSTNELIVQALDTHPGLRQLVRLRSVRLAAQAGVSRADLAATVACALREGCEPVSLWPELSAWPGARDAEQLYDLTGEVGSQLSGETGLRAMRAGATTLLIALPRRTQDRVSRRILAEVTKEADRIEKEIASLTEEQRLMTDLRELLQAPPEPADDPQYSWWEQLWATVRRLWSPGDREVRR
ncbi:hypothetical protein [Actinoplanes regularis]|uniref:Uncharacterized protein n=1 Tax=Actinoplanes regularis TaxID=52697 RepID=A0A238UVD8_9ACTN|nr:hypothetical protein [Actinoplanes regularis]GIE84387.1 hypothetical protein Are01nite_08670 [Actinoplanes regularis]SNR25834.1 hypothetical protein SAMN06264365_101193 [Actinoplanes regularis]